MTYSEIQTDDVDALSSWNWEEWRSEFVQLTPGQLGFWTRAVEIPGVRVSFNGFTQSVLVRERRCVSGASFVLVLESEGDSRFLGSPVGVGDGVLMASDVDYEYRTARGLRTLALEFDEPLPIGDGVYQRLPRQACAELVRFCREAIALARAGGDGASLKDVLFQQVLRMLEMGSAGGAVDGRGRYELVRRSVDWIQMRELGEPGSVIAAAAALGVSERTLHRAFRE